jgi:hypothetical protein
MRQSLQEESIHILSSSPAPSSEKTREESLDPAVQDSWMAISVKELQKAFRKFSKQSGRLSRLAQRKRKACIPSDGFNQLLAERLEEVERAFHLYLRRKEELLTYIETTSRRSAPVSHETGARNLRLRERDAELLPASDLAAS